MRLSLVLVIFSNAAPPEITVERSWVHASEGYDIELACIVHGDVTSDVSERHKCHQKRTLCAAQSTTHGGEFVSHDSNNHAISFSALQIENASFAIHYQFY